MTAKPISRLLAPPGIALSALVIAPFLVRSLAPAFMRAPVGPDALDAYTHNENVYNSMLAVLTFLVVASVSWMFSLLEGVRGSIGSSHIRQSALIYAYLIIELGATLYDRVFGNMWTCWVCPPPWWIIAPAALIANLLVQIRVRTQGGLTRA